MLDSFESSPADDQDRPITDIVIEDVVVLENPFREAIAELLLKDWQKRSLKDK